MRITMVVNRKLCWRDVYSWRRKTYLCYKGKIKYALTEVSNNMHTNNLYHCWQQWLYTNRLTLHTSIIPSVHVMKPVILYIRWYNSLPWTYIPADVENIVPGNGGTVARARHRPLDPITLCLRRLCSCIRFILSVNQTIIILSSI